MARRLLTEWIYYTSIGLFIGDPSPCMLHGNEAVYVGTETRDEVKQLVGQLEDSADLAARLAALHLRGLLSRIDESNHINARIAYEKLGDRVRWPNGW